jgi:hypothetical protein
MWQKVTKLFSPKNNPLNVLTTRENVVIIQIHPKQQVVSVSYKKDVRTAKFSNNVIKNMLKGGLDFESNTFEVLGAVARLIAQIIKYNK